MYRKYLVLSFLAVLTVNYAAAKEKGVGFVVGEPTGISGKIWLNEKAAIDGTAAWSFGANKAFQIYSDYLMQRNDIFKVSEGKMPCFYGVGLNLKFDDKIYTGIRFPAGLEYLFQDSPLGLFMEIALTLNISPEISGNLNGGIGARYLFK